MNNVNEIQFAASEKPKKSNAPCGCVTVIFLISILGILCAFQYFQAEEAMNGNSLTDAELEINTMTRMIIYFGGEK